MPKLTDLTLKSLPTPEKGQKDYWDTTIKGFGVRVSCGGAKTFVLNKNKRRVTLGRYPATSLADARQHALQLKYLKDNPKLISFITARDLFIQKHLSKLKASTGKEQTSALKLFTFSKPLASVTNDDVLKAVNQFKPGSARTYYNILRTFFNWAVQNDYLQHSPLKKSPFKPKSRDRLLTDEEVQLIWRESYNHNSGNVVRCLLLSGQRLSQFTKYDRAWLQGDTIVFPPTIMKSNQQHTIPASTLLKENLPLSHTNSLRTFTNSLQTIPHWTLHDFRRYFSSTMARLNVDITTTEAILDHRSGSRSQIQRVYDRFDRMEPMRNALERYEEHLRTLGLFTENT